MSKPIRFPILEIVTLLVVLFACVLVVVPGFDEFTTSMLFEPGQIQPTTATALAQNDDVGNTPNDVGQQRSQLTDVTQEDVLQDDRFASRGSLDLHQPRWATRFEYRATGNG